METLLLISQEEVSQRISKIQQGLFVQNIGAALICDNANI